MAAHRQQSTNPPFLTSVACLRMYSNLPSKVLEEPSLANSLARKLPEHIPRHALLQMEAWRQEELCGRVQDLQQRRQQQEPEPQPGAASSHSMVAAVDANPDAVLLAPATPGRTNMPANSQQRALAMPRTERRRAEVAAAPASPALWKTCEHWLRPLEAAGNSQLARLQWGMQAMVIIYMSIMLLAASRTSCGVPTCTGQVMTVVYNECSSLMQDALLLAGLHLIWIQGLWSQCCIHHLYLWLLKQQVGLLTPGGATAVMQDAVMRMLEVAAVHGGELAELGHDMTHFEAACLDARQQLEAVVAGREQAAAAAATLPPLDGADGAAPCGPGSHRCLRGVVPAERAVRGEGTGLEAAKQRAAENLGSLPLPGSSTAAQGRQWVQELLVALKKTQALRPGSSEDVAAQHALSMVECQLFSRAASAKSLAAAAALGQEGVELLAQVVDTYRSVLSTFQGTAACASRMRVELCSRELLVVWTAKCMVHAAARTAHPLVQRYGVGLSFSDLRHLCLSDRLAVDAMRGVAEYLKQHTVAGKLLFTLSDGGQATLAFSREFAGGDSRLAGLWSQEQEAAEQRQNAHWAEVQRKQRLARELAAKLEECRLKEALARQRYNRLYSDWQYEGWRHEQPSRASLNAAEKLTASTESSLQQALQPPTPVIQPLPSDQHKAFQWLFFLYMPPMLRHLSRLTFLAQQLLLGPANFQLVQKHIEVASPTTMTTAHYNSSQSNWMPGRTGRSGEDGRVILASNSEVPKLEQLKHGKDVHKYSSPSHGVWHPDSLPLHLVWAGSGGAGDGRLAGFFFNPFGSVPNAVVVDGFTEQLPNVQGAAALQWAMPQYGSGAATAADRGNLPLAQQDQWPRTWLSKPGFLTFGGLRAYPLLQMRKLAVALRERCLPLGHVAVQTLVRQAVYHVGTLTDSGSGSGSDGSQPAPMWRTDWGSEASSCGDMLSTLCEELSQLAADLEQSPREAGAVVLLGELAGYLAGWHPPLRAVARRLAAAAFRWADDLEEQASNAVPAHATALRAKQCMLRMTALLCCAAGSGDLNAADAQQLLTLAVQVHHGSVHTGSLESDNADLKATMTRLQVLCHWTLGRRADQLVAAALAQPSMLTHALRTVLQRAPAKLQWQQLVLQGSGSTATRSASFQAEGSDGHLYSINCLDGTVLEDGTPPGRLPSEILRHPLYLRTFSEGGTAWGFKVTQTAAGVYRTLAPVRGRFYEFFLSKRSSQGSTAEGQLDLVVIEIEAEAEGGRRLELLDVGEGASCAGWGQALPPRLRIMHSHWLSREKRAIVLREPHFREHDTHFILHWSNSQQPTEEAAAASAAAGAAGTPVDFVCLRVPQHWRAVHWAALLAGEGHGPLAEQLVLHKSQVLEVLSQFGQREFIHVYVPANTASTANGELWDMLFEFPRFGLEFKLQGGSLWSCDYPSCRLHPCQRLAASGSDGTGSFSGYTLPGLEQMLVLARGAQQAQAQPGGLGSSGAGQPASQLLALVPVGSVERQAGKVVIQHSDACDAKLQVYKYEVHPRFSYLQTPYIPDRLQLATMYAACGSLLPEPGSKATGAQQALLLLRQCWGTRELQPAELAQLQDAARLGGCAAAGLRLLAHEVQASACQLSSLHYPDGAPHHMDTPDCHPDWGLAYLQEGSCTAVSGVLNPRLLLTAGEEMRTLGHRRPAPAPPLWQRHRLCQPLEVPACPVEAQAVSKTEAQLQALLQRRTPMRTVGSGEAALPSYPLRVGSGEGGAAAATYLEKQMHAELEESWKVHHADLAELELVPGAREAFLQAQGRVQGWREQAEAYLLVHLATVPDSTGLFGTAFRLQQASNAMPLPSLLDLVRLALPQHSACHSNPFLSTASATRLQQAARLWLQLCVLEDKLQRLVGWEENQADRPLLVQELQTHREWSVDEHPEWLVFEAEQQLQIRPAQYWVAAHLIQHPGDIVQLNMGEGKTRVILPMLILHFAKPGSKPEQERLPTVRLNLLIRLLDEAYTHLHACLCASTLARKLLVLPFNRDVQPTPGLLAAMLSAIQHCKQEGGVLLVAPEHRLSLLLKRQEMWQQEQEQEQGQELGQEDGSNLCGWLDRVLSEPYVDLLDESDELLSHKYQLVYAWGSPTELPSGHSRTLAVHTLLHQLSQHARRAGSPIAAILARERVAVRAWPADKLGSFRGPAARGGAAGGTARAALPAGPRCAG